MRRQFRKARNMKHNSTDGRKWHYASAVGFDGLAATYGAAKLKGSHRDDAERIAA